jgi:hypothetical protein
VGYRRRIEAAMNGGATFKSRESGSPYWSTDGSSKVVVSGRPQSTDLWVMRVRSEDVFIRIRRPHRQETLPQAGIQLVEIKLRER